MKTALFIHRSVGHNLLHDGKVYELLEEAGQPLELSDYDHNTDTLTDAAGKQQHPGFVFPGGNTTPKDSATLFSDQVPSQYKPILDMAMAYDVIILKSCYPNSNIKSDEELAAIQKSYISIAEFFAGHPEKHLVILTSPPLVPMMTSPAAGKRARALANWLATTSFATNVYVFNFFDLLATPENKRQANTLRRTYRRWLPFNSHPNRKASREIAPKFVEFLVKSL